MQSHMLPWAKAGMAISLSTCLMGGTVCSELWCGLLAKNNRMYWIGESTNLTTLASQNPPKGDGHWMWREMYRLGTHRLPLSLLKPLYQSPAHGQVPIESCSVDTIIELIKLPLCMWLQHVQDNSNDPQDVLLILRVPVYQTGPMQDTALSNSTAKETRRHNWGFNETDHVFFPDSWETEPQMFLCLIMAAIEWSMAFAVHFHADHSFSLRVRPDQ